MYNSMEFPAEMCIARKVKKGLKKRKLSLERDEHSSTKSSALQVATSSGTHATAYFSKKPKIAEGSDAFVEWPFSCNVPKPAAFSLKMKSQVIHHGKENEVCNLPLKKKKPKKVVETSEKMPLSPRRPIPNRSTSAAAAMAKIASINAQAAAQRTTAPTPQRRSSLGDARPSPAASPADLPARRLCVPVPVPVPAASLGVEAKPKEEPATLPEPATNGRAVHDAISDIRQSTSSLRDSKTSAECRLSISDRMALDAERLLLHAEAEAALAAKELLPKVRHDAVDEMPSELESTVMELARQVREMQQTKQNQDQELQHHLRQATVVQAEMEQFKANTDVLRRQVDQLQRQLQSFKDEHAAVEHQLEQQLELNRRLSKRLSGHFSIAAHDEFEEDLELLQEEVATSQRTLEPASPMPTQSASHRRQRDPQTPASVAARSCHSAKRSYFDAEEPRRSSFIQVPTVTPSKAHAPAIYNEPKNKAKQQEYAQLLEQQMEEQKEKKKQDAALEHAPVVDYFPFGRPGCGAPVRDANSNVVTNITYCRSRRPVPIDHPAGPLYAKRSASQETFIPKKKH